MHIHWLQDECLTVVSGHIAYQIEGQPVQYAAEGDTILFKRGTPHRFWNDVTTTLNCTGWISPVNSVVFFLSAIYTAQNKSGPAGDVRRGLPADALCKRI